MIVIKRPAFLQQQFLEPLLQKAEDLSTTIQLGQMVNSDTHLTQFQRLQVLIQVRRGLVNTVGELTKSLFGVATDKDV